jgi:hypothetical protein
MITQTTPDLSALRTTAETMEPEVDTSFSSVVPSVIELKLDNVHQLFHELDPSPFTEKDLDREAEEFIVGWADDQPQDKPLELLLYLAERADDEANLEQRVETAIRNYFAYQRETAERRLGRLMRRGWLSLSIGLAFLALCLGAADLLRRLTSGPIFEIGNYSFIIGGWVAMSRPLEIFLYEWWPIRHERRVFDRLSRLSVRICHGAREVRPRVGQRLRRDSTCALRGNESMGDGI